MLERIGDWGHYVSLVAPFVDALVLQGRGDESRRAVELAARYTIEDDIDAQIGLRCSQVALLLLDGDLLPPKSGPGKASRSRRAPTYDGIGSGRCLLSPTCSMRLIGSEEARDVLEEAIALAEQKGSIAHERILRAKLAELAPQPPATA